MPLFLDTSALVKLYVEEKGSETMRVLVARPDLQDGLFASDLVALEVLGVFGEKLRRKEVRERDYENGALDASDLPLREKLATFRGTPFSRAFMHRTVEAVVEGRWSCQTSRAA